MKTEAFDRKFDAGEDMLHVLDLSKAKYPLDTVKKNTYPIVIGGVGGSGTRLIAQCLKQMGFFIGEDLNGANDNLWFTLLFKRFEVLFYSELEFERLVTIFLKGMTGTKNFSKKEMEIVRNLQNRNTILSHKTKSLFKKTYTNFRSDKWGWKEPNSHIFIDRLTKNFNNIKYIHVIRNGLDMAHSKNQNQLKLWGAHFLNQEIDISPYYSLKYWSIVHKRILKIGKSMGDNFLLLNYDNFCINPENGIQILTDFLNIKLNIREKYQLLKLIQVPTSIGRFKQYGTKIFDPEDVAYVDTLGFDTSTLGTQEKNKNFTQNIKQKLVQQKKYLIDIKQDLQNYYNRSIC